jgi:hypothetical protein
MTQTTSVANAVSAGRVGVRLSTGIGHHVELEGHDIGFVAGGEAGL